MIVMQKTKRIEIIKRIQVCLISWMNFNNKENGGKNAFLANPKHLVYPNMENMIVMPITKRMEIIISIQVCLLSRLNFDYTKKGGKNAFLADPKHQYRVSQCGEFDCRANNKMKGNYYEYPSLSHFMDEL